MELEPRHRVFFRNLADLLLSRRLPPVPVTSRPARFWPDVFVPAGLPWTAFMESMIWHVLLTILFVWGQSRVWVRVEPFKKETFHTPITYYPPPKSFPASASRAPSARARTRPKPVAKQQVAHQSPKPPAMPVRPQQKPSLVTPPDIKQATAMPNLPGSHPVTPIVPFSAAADARRNPLAGPAGVVAPQPQVDEATARRLGLPHASVVAPAPDLAGTSAMRTLKAPDASDAKVVPPAPSVQNAANSAAAARLAALNGAKPNVVPPAPSVRGTGHTANARLGSVTGSGSQVVPPPPSLPGSGRASEGTRVSSLSGEKPSVIPPQPSVDRAGNGGDTRRGSMSGGTSQVVPPPPAMQSSAARGNRLGNAISGDGSRVVPPPPAVAGNAPGGRLSSLSGTALSGNPSQVVPPQPAVATNGLGGRIGALPPGSPDASHIARPSALASAGNSGTGKMLEPMDPLPSDGSSAPTVDSAGGQDTFQELPLGLIGLVFAAPGTSVFSNFEVFVAKRRVGKDQLQLMKLVYEFLPYQRRLSEYNLNNLPPRVIKLRVVPDPSCDESLGQILQSHTDSTLPPTAAPKLPAALLSYDLNSVLPCFRTSADDFQKAMAPGH